MLNATSKKNSTDKWIPYAILCPRCHRLIEIWSENEGIILDDCHKTGGFRSDMGDSIYENI